MIENPVLRGFCPDPSIVRAGEDYYIAASTFEWWPGVKLFHSGDLENWEQLPSPLRRESQLQLAGDPPSGGVWAPDLSYDGKRFYLVYTDVKTKKGRFYNTHNYMVWAEDIKGPWSEPVYLNSIGFDPSLFHDRDGKKYLVNMVNGFRGILVQEIRETKDGWRLTGERKKIYDGSGIGCTEGPHLYHIGNWYYLLTAEGGTGYEHCVTLARSDSLWGPYETAPGNPILTSDRENPKALQKCGHGDLVETPEGEWYLACLCARPLAPGEGCILGRETALQKMRWTQDGWLTAESGTRYLERTVPSPGGWPHKPVLAEGIEDDFSQEALSVEYTSPRTSYEEFADLRARRGYLRLRGRESLNSLHHVSLLAVRQKELQAVAETLLEFTPRYPEQAAGLAYLYDALNWYLLVKTADEEGRGILTLWQSDRGTVTDCGVPVLLPEGVPLGLRAVTSRDCGEASFYYQIGEEGWRLFQKGLSTRILTDEYCRGFTGAHFGMYVHDMTGLGYCGDFEHFSVFYHL